MAADARVLKTVRGHCPSNVCMLPEECICNKAFTTLLPPLSVSFFSPNISSSPPNKPWSGVLFGSPWRPPPVALSATGRCSEHQLGARRGPAIREQPDPHHRGGGRGQGRCAWGLRSLRLHDQQPLRKRDHLFLRECLRFVAGCQQDNWELLGKTVLNCLCQPYLFFPPLPGLDCWETRIQSIQCDAQGETSRIVSPTVLFF